ncbi:MAG: hypothetical protein V4617_14775 [Gemmatimonadota bacterium]
MFRSTSTISSLLSALALASVTALVACSDSSADAVAPTEPVKAAAAAVVADSATGEILTLADDAPSICQAYLARRNSLKAQLAQNPTDEDLQGGVADYNEYLSSNCR